MLQLPSVLHPVGCAAQCAGRFMCRGVLLCRTQLYFVVRTHTLEYKVILFSREQYFVELGNTLYYGLVLCSAVKYGVVLCSTLVLQSTL